MSKKSHDWKSGTLPKMFWDKVSFAANGCWEWKAYTNAAGYGMFGVGSRKLDGYHKIVRVHRLMYEHLNGPVPSGMFVCHKCDNRKCCNPNHLFLGTQRDNQQDCIAKGRKNAPTGESHNKVKLTEAQVLQILGLYKFREYGYHKLAKRFFVDDSTVKAIIRGETWRHLSRTPIPEPPSQITPPISDKGDPAQ